jgi:hypothetical protein
MLRREKINSLANFSLGLITKIKELNGMDMKATPDCMDVYADIDGSLNKRLGATRLNATFTGAGSYECNGLFDFEGTAIASFGTSYYKMDELDGTWDSLQTGMKDELIQCDDYLGNLVIANWGWDFAKTMQVGGTSLTILNSTSVAGRGKHPKVYKDHLLMSGVPGYEYTEYYSEVNDMDDFANGGTWPIVTHDGDRLTGHGELQGRLYSFKRWSIHQMTYRGGSPYWVRTQITWGIGTRSPMSIKNVTLKNGEEVLMFLGSDRKIYQFDGYDCNPVSSNFEENNGISPIAMDTLNQGSLEFSHAVVDPAKHWYILYVANGGSSNMTHAIVYNYFTGACWPFSDQFYKSSMVATDKNGYRWIITGGYEGYAFRWGYGIEDEANWTRYWSEKNTFTAYNDSGGTGAMTREADSNCVLGYRKTLASSLTAVDDYTYSTDSPSSVWDYKVDNTKGYVVKARLKVVTSGSDKGQEIYGLDGTYEWIVVFKTTSISIDAIWISEATQTYTVNTSNAYHTYEIVVKGTSIKVYMDDTLRITGTLDNTTITKTISWGDVGVSDNMGGTAYWEYFKYRLADNTRKGETISAYHTTPRLLLSKDAGVELDQVVISLKAISDDSILFYQRTDYNESWSDAHSIKLGKVKGESGSEYYLGVDFALNTATLGPARIVKEETFGLDEVGEYVQFKISDSLITKPWTLYSYSFPARQIGIFKQEI